MRGVAFQVQFRYSQKTPSKLGGKGGQRGAGGEGKGGGGRGRGEMLAAT